jgi:alkylation response protein AidB-like acyl-CoA dehydrogenase
VIENLIAPEQMIMRDTLARFLSEQRTGERGESESDIRRGGKPLLWSALANDLGLLGAALPEDLGGLGGGVAENMIIMEELGRALAGEPYLSTVVLGGGLLTNSGGPLAQQLIPKIIAGEITAAFAYAEPQSRYNVANVQTSARRSAGAYRLNGSKSVVHLAPWATHLFITGRTGGKPCDTHGISLFLLDQSAPGIRRTDFTTIDGSRASDLMLEDVLVESGAMLGNEGDALPLVERILDEGCLALCADAIGVMRQLIDDTVGYARQRRQFGRPIADFQVLRHRMVDMMIELQQAIAITSMASSELDSSPAHRSKAVSAAKWRVGKACRFVSQSAIQIHGGIGTTAELPVSRYFKRATAFESRFGNSDHHLQRYIGLMRESDA